MVAFGVLLVSLLGSLLLTPAVIRAAEGWSLYDVPDDGRRVHTRPVPRVGGVVVFIAMLLGLGGAAIVDLATGGAMLQSNVSYTLGIVLGTSLLFVTGLVDDLRELRPVTKLSLQLLAATLAYVFGFRITSIGMGGEFTIEFGWLALPLTLLWIVGVTNAFNLIDGLDGLATGIALVALTATAAAAQMLNNTEVVVVCLALIGALIGFMRYNFNPARIFLGDSGSLFVGYLLAILSVHGSMKSATAVIVLVPLSALALPLLDTVLAIGRRWLRGVPLSSPDSRHIHHRLLASGFTHRSAVFLLHCVAAALAVGGIAIAFAPQRDVFLVAVGGGVACAAILFYGLRHLDYHEFFEAAAVLFGGVLRVRQVISDQIHARDLAQVIRPAEDLEEVNNALRTHVGHFNFLDMEVCRESAAAVWLHTLDEVQQQRAWKVDVPVELRNRNNQDPYVLRIWCGKGRTFRPRGAERVAAILAGVLEEWLQKMRAEDPAFDPEAAVDLLDFAARQGGPRRA